jgi:hypothetical protein
LWIIQALEKFARSPGGSAPEMRRVLGERLAQKHALMAAFLIREHDMQGAREHLAAVARLHPTPVTWARLALAKTGPIEYPFLRWAAHSRLGSEADAAKKEK